MDLVQWATMGQKGHHVEEIEANEFGFDCIYNANIDFGAIKPKVDRKSRKLTKAQKLAHITAVWRILAAHGLI